MTHPIVEKISVLMQKKKISKKALSDAAGIDYDRLYTWFRDDRPNAKPNGEDIVKVAIALEVSVQQLVGAEQIPQKSGIDEIISVYDSVDEKRRAEILTFARYLRDQEQRESTKTD